MADSLKCPKCGAGCEREEVDVWPGNVYGPWGCPSCGWALQDEINAMLDKVSTGYTHFRGAAETDDEFRARIKKKF